MFEKCDQSDEQRRQNARYLHEGLKDNTHLTLARPIQASRRMYLLFGVLIMRHALRERSCQELLRRGNRGEQDVCNSDAPDSGNLSLSGQWG